MLEISSGAHADMKLEFYYFCQFARTPPPPPPPVPRLFHNDSFRPLWLRCSITSLVTQTWSMKFNIGSYIK